MARELRLSACLLKGYAFLRLRPIGDARGRSRTFPRGFRKASKLKVHAFGLGYPFVDHHNYSSNLVNRPVRSPHQSKGLGEDSRSLLAHRETRERSAAFSTKFKQFWRHVGSHLPIAGCAVR
jgi:hypothetical protein